MRKYMLAFLVKWFIYLFCGCLTSFVGDWEKNRKARGMKGSEGKRGTVALRPPAFSRLSHHYGPGSCCRRELEQIFPQDKDVSVCVFFKIEIQTMLLSFCDLRVCPQVTLSRVFLANKFLFTLLFNWSRDEGIWYL